MLTGRNVYFLLFLQTDYKFENVSFIKKNKTKNNSCTKFLIWNKCTHYVNKLWNKYVPKGFQVKSQFHKRRKKKWCSFAKSKVVHFSYFIHVFDFAEGGRAENLPFHSSTKKIGKEKMQADKQQIQFSFLWFICNDLLKWFSLLFLIQFSHYGK